MTSAFLKSKEVGQKHAAIPTVSAAALPAESDFSTETSAHVDMIEGLQRQIEALRLDLAVSQAQNDAKDKVVKTLEERLEKNNLVSEKSGMLPDAMISQILLSRLEEQQPDLISLVQRWLIVDGCKLPDVETFITQYADRCCGFGIPLDRVVIFGAMLHPKFSSYIWKWEVGKQLRQKELRNELEVGPDEPFTLLMQGKTMEYRMKGSDGARPRGCMWFKNQNFQDYFALPFHHNGECKGGIAWSTKSVQGFKDEHIKVFRKSLWILATIMRCHTNDLAISSLLHRLDDEIQDQTTELETANKSLAEANKKILRQAESQLRNFAMMSHEIRTPLNCVVGLSNLLLVSELDPATRENVEMIADSGDLLLAVVDDVLDYSKLAAGKVETKFEQVELSRVVRGVVAAVDIRAKPFGVELRTKIAQDLPSIVETDGRRLQQILYNLLDNAIKFGQDGQVVDFTVDAISRDQDFPDHDDKKKVTPPSEDDLIRFIVKDYGRGIVSSEMHKIFQPFHQATTNEPKHGGTGLGLAITRQLVRVLGGTVSVESEYGCWCQFTALFPINPERPIMIPHQKGGRDETEGSIRPQNTSGHSSISNWDKRVEGDDSYTSHDDSSVSTSSSIDHHNFKAVDALSYHDQVENACLIGETRMRPMEIEDNPELKDSPNTCCDDTQKRLGLSEDCQRVEKQPPVDFAPCPIQTSLKVVTAERKAVELDTVKVLVAEDNKINQKILHRTLTRIGLHDITIVENGKEAMDICKEMAFNCIFMDIQMPIMDGLEATKVISSDKKERNEHFPKIAFLTAHALQDYKDKAFESGADCFISKPFKIDVIHEFIIKSMETLQD